MQGQEVTFSSRSCEWETPQDLFNDLDHEFHFTLDAASTDENAKCEKHYTIADDGLARDWSGETVWCNPPYGRDVGRWVQKAATEARRNKITVVMLLHARTDTRWFHRWIYKKPDVEVRFVKGRLTFGGSTNKAPFPSMIVVFRGGDPE